jgi:hypothetical protein
MRRLENLQPAVIIAQDSKAISIAPIASWVVAPEVMAAS